eukprot:TRINITY_DN1192_c0_g1_i1.p1 TRINITY_DN1192_c0_g1~~TRINITY_DN1192_c0_g1_i1.p1  ORF type:complete len:792 (+),score=247.82 TRINITY_DN1192_c0_g1_i1:32-2377(+)
MATSSADSNLVYPVTRRTDCIDNPGKTPDPYRWLEDPDSAETKEWVEAQNKFTEGVYKRMDPKNRENIHRNIESLMDYPKYGCPFKRNGYFYFFKNDGLQNQSVMYRKKDVNDDDEKAETFLDPNLLSADGTVALKNLSFSEGETLLAYGLSTSGSDWTTIKLRSTESAEDKGDMSVDTLEWVKFSSISWTHDDKGFFYSRYPTPKTLETAAKGGDTGAAAAADGAGDGAADGAGDGAGDCDDEKSAGTEVDSALYHKIFYHRIGTPQSSDVFIYGRDDEPKWMFGGHVTQDGAYLLIVVHEGCKPANQLYYMSIGADFPPPAAPAAADADAAKDGALTTADGIVKLIDTFDFKYDYVTNEGSLFYFQTNDAAPRDRLISIDIEKPARENWCDIIPHHAQHVLASVESVAGDKVLVAYVQDVVDRLHLYRLKDGHHIQEIELPSVGTISSTSCRKKENYIFYSFTSFLHAGTVLSVSVDGDVVTAPRVVQDTKPKGFERAGLTAKQVFYTSKDGTKVPMFIVGKDGALADDTRDGSSPCLLYGYGGFNISIQPAFSCSWINWIRHLGGVLVIANIRGGSEYGEDWHQGGIKERKQNVFDDFCGAAQYLAREKYTSPDRLVINGGSNGGLLVGACINQHPELFACGVAQVGVMDMLRFHKFTIGHAWCSDYGCADNEDDFKYLIKYSPVHNVPPADTNAPFPAVLLTTADHDDRVVPLHSFKYISALQHTLGDVNSKGDRPLIIRIDTKAGHGAGKPTSKRIEESADMYAFIAYVLGLKWKE